MSWTGLRRSPCPSPRLSSAGRRRVAHLHFPRFLGPSGRRAGGPDSAVELIASPVLESAALSTRLLSRRRFTRRRIGFQVAQRELDAVEVEAKDHRVPVDFLAVAQ